MLSVMRTTRVLDVIDRVTDGAVADSLRQWQQEEKTLQEIVFAIRDQWGVTVSPSSVTRWMRDRNGDGEAA